VLGLISWHGKDLGSPIVHRLHRCANSKLLTRRHHHDLFTQSFTMSSNLPLRTIRIPALRQKCLFQQYRHAPLPRAFSTTTPQSFASTSPRLRGGSSLRNDRAMTKAAARGQMGAAPKVNEMKQQQEGVMAEDIGLLQDTVVRASWRKLPAVWSASFWSYTWKLLKSKGTALYSYVRRGRLH
jgi:protein MBA1